MGIRREQVEKIKKARREFKIAQNLESGSTKSQRARTNAVIDGLLRTSSKEEVQQAYSEDI